VGNVHVNFTAVVYSPTNITSLFYPISKFSYFYSARIASAVLATAIPSVCLSVRQSVTRWYCVKTMASSTAQFALSDSKMCLVLQKPKNIPQRRPLPLKSWLQVTYPFLKAASFDTFCLLVSWRMFIYFFDCLI